MRNRARPQIAVIDYGIGNLRSAQKALERVGADARLVDDPDQVKAADGAVLPGVGAFEPCRQALHARGLDRSALECIDAGVPFLGICVGFQLLYERSEESPGVRGLGVFKGSVHYLGPDAKHPQMQWNVLRRVVEGAEMLEGLGDEPWMYFVHSLFPETGPETVATCDYGGTISAGAESSNVWGTQFHPEKSSEAGLKVLSNFVAKCTATRNGEDSQ